MGRDYNAPDADGKGVCFRPRAEDLRDQVRLDPVGRAELRGVAFRLPDARGGRIDSLSLVATRGEGEWWTTGRLESLRIDGGELVIDEGLLTGLSRTGPTALVDQPGSFRQEQRLFELAPFESAEYKYRFKMCYCLL